MQKPRLRVHQLRWDGMLGVRHGFLKKSTYIFILRGGTARHSKRRIVRESCCLYAATQCVLPLATIPQGPMASTVTPMVPKSKRIFRRFERYIIIITIN